MASPTKTQFFDAANYVYRDDSTLPDTLTPLQNRSGATVTGLVRGDGFYGAALETSGGQIIVSFEGTDLGGLQSNPGFVQPQIKADLAIYNGQNPAAYRDALRFTRRVLKVAAAEGISSDDVFVDGHSLGGAEAEFVAAKTGLGGRTFGAPGLPASDFSADKPSTLVNYVDYGDPVGNYSANPLVEGNFLASDDIERFGAATYVGDPSSAEALGQTGQLYGTSSVGNVLALGMLADATVQHHLLQDYAADLGITSAAATPDWMSNLDASQLGAVLAQIVGGQTASTASLSAQATSGSLTAEIAGLAQAIGGTGAQALLQSGLADVAGLGTTGAVSLVADHTKSLKLHA